MRERVTVISLSVCQHLMSKTAAVFTFETGMNHELGDDLSLLNVMFKK